MQQQKQRASHAVFVIRLIVFGFSRNDCRAQSAVKSLEPPAKLQLGLQMFM